MYEQNIQQGFIALMSSIIISIILMTMVLTVSTSSFYARFDALGGENKRESLGLAEGCMNLALLRLAENPSAPDWSVFDGDCVVNPPAPPSSGYPKTFDITITAKHFDAFSNIRAEITMQDPESLAVSAWEEIPAMP
ncbi:MAG TPA: hypothetical protein VJJ02_02790 [Candidatus Paceibacterota bacterium]